MQLQPAASSPTRHSLSGSASCQASFSDSGDHRQVHLGGDVDIASRDLVEEACRATGGSTVDVDLSAVTFMDSAGYGALLRARSAAEYCGGSLTLSNETGQPGRLMAMLGGFSLAGTCEASAA